jgi:thiamine-phosphate pyrophosphorylase
MELILISYPDFFKGETEIVSSLLDQFDFTFHLRKPGAEIEGLAGFMQKIPAHLYHKIVVSNSIEVLEKFNVKGIHFSTANRNQQIDLPKDTYCGTSCHSLSEISDLNESFNYAYLSPVFPSISKKGYHGNLDMEQVSAFLMKDRSTKVYALGGIDTDKISKLEHWAFDGIAVLGSVWTDDPLNSLNEIKSNFHKIHSQIQTIK